MITDWAVFNLSYNDRRERKSSANKSSAFIVTLPRLLYKPEAWFISSGKMMDMTMNKYFGGDVSVSSS